MRETLLFSFSLSEIIAILVFLGGLIGIWINTRIRIAKIETEIADMRVRLAETNKRIESAFEKFYSENKEEHRELMHDVKEIQKSINSLNIQIVEKK